jgi:hypothetical protein
MADTALHLADRVLTVDILRRHLDVEIADPEMTAAIIVHVIEALTH